MNFEDGFLFPFVKTKLSGILQKRAIVEGIYLFFHILRYEEGRNSNDFTTI